MSADQKSEYRRGYETVARDFSTMQRTAAEATSSDEEKARAFLSGWRGGGGLGNLNLDMAAKELAGLFAIERRRPDGQQTSQQNQKVMSEVKRCKSYTQQRLECILADDHDGPHILPTSADTDRFRHVPLGRERAEPAGFTAEDRQALMREVSCDESAVTAGGARSDAPATATSGDASAAPSESSSSVHASPGVRRRRTVSGTGPNACEEPPWMWCEVCKLNGARCRGCFNVWATDPRNPHNWKATPTPGAARVPDREVCRGVTFERAPGRCGGAWVLDGTRMTVWTLRSLYTSGMSSEAIQGLYPHLTFEQVEAAVALPVQLGPRWVEREKADDEDPAGPSSRAVPISRELFANLLKYLDALTSSRGAELAKQLRVAEKGRPA